MLARKIGIRSIQAFPQPFDCSTFEELAVPVFSSFSSSADSDDDQREHEGCNNKKVFESKSFSDNTNRLSAPELSSQTELNDLVRDLGLSKKAE